MIDPAKTVLLIGLLMFIGVVWALCKSAAPTEEEIANECEAALRRELDDIKL